jgi:hypothetical protein
MIAATLLLAASLPVMAGTLIYKVNKKAEPQTASKVKIISIEKGYITIEQNKGKKTIPLRWIEKYYDTDIQGGAFEDNTSDYTVSITNVKMPKSGYETTNKKSKKKRMTSECEIEYSISRKTEPGKSKSMKMPYFYLYVLTTRSKSYGKLPVEDYYYPKEAKVKSKTYDEAKIVEKVTSLDRPLVWNGGRDSMRSSTSRREGFSGMGGRVAKIPLKNVKYRKIIAYHIEVWGKSKIVAEKTWNDPSYKIGKLWWKKY